MLIKSLKGADIAAQIESGVPLVLKDRSLIPSSDLSDIGLKRTKLNAQGKKIGLRAFGEEYVRFCSNTRYSFNRSS